jgi:hypothetical protein
MVTTSAQNAQRVTETQARKSVETARHDERFQALKRAEEEQIEAKTMQLRALRLAREGHAPARGGAAILIPRSD